MQDTVAPSSTPLAPTTPSKNIEAFQALLEIDAKERKMKEQSGRTKSYVLSVLIPPIGVYYCVKYVFFSRGTEEDIRAGFISLALTVVSGLVSIWLMSSMFAQMSSLGIPQDGNIQEIQKLYQ